MLTLVIVMLAQTPQPRLFLQPNLSRRGGPAYAFFEFAPASGAGMGTPCACTTPTGAKGEVMTFSRASSGTCLKGGTTTGIANGDMVTCTSNQPRVMPGGDGSGGLGLLVEGARTNSILRSQEFDNAAWSKAAFGDGVAPVVTADAAVAPDGTTTAERVQFSATTGGYSMLVQTVASAAYSSSVWIKGNGTSGTLDMLIGPTVVCAACSFNASAWTRCLLENQSGRTSFQLGNESLDCHASGALAAKDVFVFGADMEVGAFASSYIATTSASVTRAADQPDLAVTFGAGTTGFSMAGTAVFEGLPTNPVELGCIGDKSPGTAGGSTSYACPDILSAVVRADTTASSTAVYSTGVAGLITSRRFVEYFTAAGVHNGCVDGVCGAGDTGKAWTPPTWTRWRIGEYSTDVNQSWGVVKQLCLDPNPSRCR